MCLIIVKPQYCSMPPDKYIANAYNNNPNGFGLAYWEQGMDAVHIEKGAMSIKSIFKMLDGVPNTFDKVILMHFRFATNGDVCPENCHPFPIASDIWKLQALDLDTTLAIAHNGIILDFNTKSFDYKDYNYSEDKGYWTKELDGLSDTQEFIRDYLVDCGRAIYNRGVKKMIEAFTESKFAILAVGGRVDLIGEFEKEAGLFYSNLSHKWEPVYVPPKKTNTAYKSDVLKYDRKGKCWVNPKHHPDGDFDETPARFGFCDICQEWGRLTEFEEAWICPQCHNYYEQGVYTNV